MVELLVFPHRGIGPFVLGSSRSSIVLAVGNPDYVETTTDSSVPQEEWHYDRLNVRLTFSGEHNWRLGSISALGSHAVFNGVRFIGRHTTDLGGLCDSAGIGDLLSKDGQKVDRINRSSCDHRDHWNRLLRVNQANECPFGIAIASSGHHARALCRLRTVTGLYSLHQH